MRYWSKTFVCQQIALRKHLGWSETRWMHRNTPKMTLVQFLDLIDGFVKKTTVIQQQNLRIQEPPMAFGIYFGDFGGSGSLTYCIGELLWDFWCGETLFCVSVVFSFSSAWGTAESAFVKERTQRKNQIALESFPCRLDGLVHSIPSLGIIWEKIGAAKHLSGSIRALDHFSWSECDCISHKFSLVLGNDQISRGMCSKTVSAGPGDVKNFVETLWDKFGSFRA